MLKPHYQSTCPWEPVADEESNLGAEWERRENLPAHLLRQQSILMKTKMPRLPDDQMIQHPDLYGASRFDYAASQSFVFL